MNDLTLWLQVIVILGLVAAIVALIWVDTDE